MQQTTTPESWHSLANNLHELITVEIQAVDQKSLTQLFPKLIVMYEFFRLVRGEAFHNSRPSGLGDLQKKMYQMEDDLARQLAQLKTRLDPNDAGTKYYLEQMKKSFNIE